jgi:hypothetical protein
MSQKVLFNLLPIVIGSEPQRGILNYLIFNKSPLWDLEVNIYK